MPREVTISACQYHVREINAFEDIAARVRILLEQASGSDRGLSDELSRVEENLTPCRAGQPTDA